MKEYNLVREIRRIDEENRQDRLSGNSRGPSLKRGECLVETAFGSIDARIDTQLENIKEELFQALEEGTSA